MRFFLDIQPHQQFSINKLSPDMRNYMLQELKPTSMTLIIVTYNEETPVLRRKNRGGKGE
jgi:hypothetical protein